MNEFQVALLMYLSLPVLMAAFMVLIYLEDREKKKLAKKDKRTFIV